MYPVFADPLVEQLIRIIVRWNLTDIEVGAVSNLSPNTIRWLRATGKPPKQPGTISALKRFIAFAEGVRRRSEFHLAERPQRRRVSR